MPRPDEIGVPSNWGRWGDKDELGAANLINTSRHLELEEPPAS